MSKEDVTHKGIVERVEPDRLIIRTNDDHKCDGCAVVALCNSKSSDAGEMLVIDCREASEFSVGDRVAVSATSSSTLLATWWALALPTVIFAGVILGCRLLFPSLGGWSVAIGFGALAIYDLFLYMLRRRFAQKIIWKVSRM